MRRQERSIRDTVSVSSRMLSRPPLRNDTMGSSLSFADFSRRFGLYKIPMLVKAKSSLRWSQFRWVTSVGNLVISLPFGSGTRLCWEYVYHTYHGLRRTQSAGAQMFVTIWGTFTPRIGVDLSGI